MAVQSVLSTLVELDELSKETELISLMAVICIRQLRKDEGGQSNTHYVQLLGRFPPQIVDKAVGRIRKELLASVSLASWVHNETTITSRASQQFFDYIFKGIMHFAVH